MSAQEFQTFTVRDRRAVARTESGYADAKAAKVANPTLQYESIEWRESHGVCVVSLMWLDGRWC